MPRQDVTINKMNDRKTFFRAYMELNDLADAEKYLKEDIRINDSTGRAIEDAQTAKIKLARLYLKMHRPAAVEGLLKELARDLSTGRGKSTTNDDIKAGFYALQWQLAEEDGRLSDVVRYLKKDRAFSDSLNHLNSGLKHADMDQAFAAQQEHIK